MAVRNPGTWNEFMDPGNFLPREEVVERDWDDLIEDQIYVLDAPKLLHSSCFIPVTTGKVAHTSLFNNKWSLDANVTEIKPDNVWVYAWADDAATSITVTVTIMDTDHTTVADVYVGTYAADASTKRWRTCPFSASTSDFDVADSNALTAKITCAVTEGAGDAWVAGLLIVAPET